MNAEQTLKTYISKHPDYWEFENEMKEVEKLKEVCYKNSTQHNNQHKIHHSIRTLY